MNLILDTENLMKVFKETVVVAVGALITFGLENAGVTHFGHNLPFVLVGITAAVSYLRHLFKIGV